MEEGGGGVTILVKGGEVMALVVRGGDVVVVFNDSTSCNLKNDAEAHGTHQSN